MEEKVKCKICGKVGFAKDKKGLSRHLRLIHNKSVSKKDSNKHFEPAEPDSIIEIRSSSLKSLRKEQNKKWTEWKRPDSRGKNPFARIIYTPMKNG